MKTGIELIAAERQRQIDVEGWTPEHDAEHTHGELSRAAGIYANRASLIESQNSEAFLLEWGVPDLWPWSGDWWKPSKDPIRNLEKAGALIAAELDRLLRARAEPTP